MSDDNKYVATDHARDIDHVYYALMVLACVDDLLNRKPSYPSIDDATYALMEARERLRKVRDSLEACDND